MSRREGSNLISSYVISQKQQGCGNGSWKVIFSLRVPVPHLILGPVAGWRIQKPTKYKKDEKGKIVWSFSRNSKRTGRGSPASLKHVCLKHLSCHWCLYCKSCRNALLVGLTQVGSLPISKGGAHAKKPCLLQREQSVLGWSSHSKVRRWEWTT